MNDKAFPTTVRVTLGGAARNVATAYEALECLLGPWPIIACREYRRALRACRDCLDGLQTPTSALRAFKAAARVAGVLPGNASLIWTAPGQRPPLRAEYKSPTASR